MMLSPQGRTARSSDSGQTTLAVPSEVTSAEAKLVYLYLSVRGRATVDELGESLGLPKLALFSILGTLREHGLVARDGDVAHLS